MRRLQRITAMLLCVIMMIPTQALTVLAESETQIFGEGSQEEMEETLPVEYVEEETERIEETLPLEAIEKEDEWDGELVIYWNPGSVQPVATSSDAEAKNIVKKKSGKDSADGLTPNRAVKTLAVALERAEQMQEDMGVELSEITICAMNPMEIADGQLYVLNGQHINITSWAGRTYDNDTIFYLNGGQLTLRNVSLNSGKNINNSVSSQLIWVDGGSVQFGQNVEISGQVVMDYRFEKEKLEWQIATPSDAATSSDAIRAKEESLGFDINDYILYEGDDYLEFVQDESNASTWKLPVIELLEGFEETQAGYQIQLYSERDTNQIELVRSLYADELTAEEFEGMFTLAEINNAEWELIAYSQKAGNIRNTGSADLLRFLDLMDEEYSERERELVTTKVLRASRAVGDKVVYWNPGGTLTIEGIAYPGGSDEAHDGNVPEAPVKTLGEAFRIAKDGTIICMQELKIEDGADEYLSSGFYNALQADGSYLISPPEGNQVTITTWERNIQPVFHILKDETLILDTVILEGIVKNGVVQSTQAVLCNNGYVEIREKVVAETGYIHINASNQLADRPVRATSTDEGIVTLFFGGINDNLSYRFVDVVVPAGELAVRAANDVTDAEEVGAELGEKFKLERSHRDDLHGGKSQFDWILRQDTTEDDQIANPQNLELYANYYYDAIYLDGIRGDDGYLGATCTYPVKTWEKAKEIWSLEMKRSIDARREAKLLGAGVEDIEKRYPVPKVIYICGTVTADENSDSIWFLTEELDYDDTTIIKTEVRPHMKSNIESEVLSHNVPKVMFRIKGKSSIVFKDLFIRNTTNEKDSVTVLVEDGTLELDGGTILTGEEAGTGGVKTVTYGTHIQVEYDLSGASHANATLEMNPTWMGSVEKRQHGVVVKGTNSVVNMHGGKIQRNNSYDSAMSTSSLHDKGAGVVLKDGASMVMTDGEISDNTVFQFGAGIYMEGNQTSLNMTGGRVAQNKMARKAAGAVDTYTTLTGYGIGIYAGYGTIVNLGSDSGSIDDVMITENQGYLTQGVGIYSEGTLNMKRITVSNNISDLNLYSSTYQGYNSAGIGVNVSGLGILEMDECSIVGNETKKTSTSTSYYENCYGAGVYINSSGNHILKNSNISRNRIGYSYQRWDDPDTHSDDRGFGGGIAIDKGNVELENCIISNNKSGRGGGISVRSAANSLSTLTIKNTEIIDNIAHRSHNYLSDDTFSPSNMNGQGGGILVSTTSANYKVELNILDGTVLKGNKARYGGAGFSRINYNSGSSQTNPYVLINGEDKRIQIEDNSASTYGGAWYSRSGSIRGKEIDIIKNKASSNGGGLFGDSAAYFYLADTSIHDNEASSGGGVYISSGRSIFSNLSIKNNKATSGNGGGVYIGGNAYFSDLIIEENIAKDSGGGIFNASTLYLTESEAKKSSINKNKAARGGGIYTGSSVIMKLAGDFQNVAETQGSNIYFTGSSGSFYVLDGKFKQPEAPIPGVYNLYTDKTGGSGFWLDLSQDKVTIEKKSDGLAEAIYLNTGDSYLTYFETPDGEGEAELPIDLNPVYFKTGSVVIKPANASSISLIKPKLDSMGIPDGTMLEYIPYSQLQDAALNLKYSTGGILPRRAQLGGYQDSLSSTLNNVVLVGEGIYLSSAGNDSEDGLSPQTAVATFARAEERLKEEIEIAYESDTKKEGYSPFIYICGNVLINSDETWELDSRNDPFFTDMNKAYEIAEQKAGEIAYPAQVRRFASFIAEPMIQIEHESQKIQFNLDNIIINGMQEAVVVNDQGTKSPILKIGKNATTTLGGYAEIYNNYSTGIELYGKLNLEGEADDLNEQIKDHSLRYIWIRDDAAVVDMKGYSKLSPKDYKGTSTYGIYSDTGGIIRMQNFSQIYGKDAAGNKRLSHGIYHEKNTGSIQINMTNNSKISELSSSYGIYLNGNGSKIYMEEDASIANVSQGITCYGTNSSISMKGAANISNTTYGMYFSGSKHEVFMNDFANISDTSSYGIYAAASDLGIYMNTNIDADEMDSAKITRKTKGSTGIYVAALGVNVEMDKHAEISNCSDAIYFGSSMYAGNKINIKMKGDSKIRSCTNGIRFYNAIRTPVLIHLMNSAAIEGNSGAGIKADEYSAYGISDLHILMEKDSRISGNGTYGVALDSSLAQSADGIRITMDGASVIGGTEFYNTNNPKSGNRYTGLRSNAPIKLTMNGDSSISGNGSNEIMNTSSSGLTNAIYLYRNTNSIAGESQITLNKNASISQNRGGIYIPDTMDPTRPNLCKIILEGNNGTPKIEHNTDGIYLGKEAILQVRGSSYIGEPSYKESGRARSIINYGEIVLDGRSQIDGPIQLYNQNKPIVMTALVDNPVREYHLEIDETFLGRPVVVPNDPDESLGGVTDVSAQLRHFTKDLGYGLAADPDKRLVSMSKNIVLQGENNVYMSGNGLDSNDGNSPTSPVRTFKRAKELLEGDGYFTKGANIIICGATIDVNSTYPDTDWSFEAGGTVTNSVSKDTWNPLVIRHKDFTGTLITIDKSAGDVNFENIIIDGGLEQGICLDSNKNVIDYRLLTVNQQAKATLGKGAILQNNGSKYYGSTWHMNLGVYINGGTLEMDGGTIRGLERTAISMESTSSNNEYGGLAIACKNGVLIFKSGTITDNTWTSKLYSTNTDVGMISLNNGSKMEMRGGSITGNKLIKQSEAGSMIVVKNSLLEMSGGIIRDNTGGKGSAIAYKGSGTGINGCIISGGQISGNKTLFNDLNPVSPIKEYSPVYVGGTNFQLKGGAANISDCIYLDSTLHNIKISSNIYQTGRLYQVYVNQGYGTGQYKKGSVVVQPDGTWISDVTPYLSYFEVKSNPYILDRGQTERYTGMFMENECLLLMHAVYLDSVKGNDSLSGTKPSQAVKTFTKAKERGEQTYSENGSRDEHYVIYLTGPAINTVSESRWSLSPSSYMCRYTGFTVYEASGLESADPKREYKGPLVVPERDLELDGISIYGRRNIDAIDKNGDSIVKIPANVTVTMKETSGIKTILGRNQNTGTYLIYDDDKNETISQNLDSKGGAVQIQPGGSLVLQGGTILETDAVYGKAIYVGADAADDQMNARLSLANKPSVSGDVYLAGSNVLTAAYVEAVKSYVPQKALQIEIQNDYSGRPVVQYTDGTIPGIKELEYYKFSDSIQGLYSIVNRDQEKHILELQMRHSIYLDGMNGNDANNGLTPETAYKTLNKVYQSLENSTEEGTVVIIVDTVEINAGEDITITNLLVGETSMSKQHYQGSYDDGTDSYNVYGQVYFMRYAQPDAYDSGNPVYKGFSNPTLLESLFKVKDGGKLSLNGIYIDGHSKEYVGSDIIMNAKGVRAQSPLVTVEETGVLVSELMSRSDILGAVDTATLFTNNINDHNKTKVLGTINGSEIREGSSAGIELLDGGTCHLVKTEFRNLELGSQVVAGGTDIYSDGTVHYKDDTLFSGSVFLEGLGVYGVESTYSSSRFLTIDAYGRPMLRDYQVLMRDPYMGRKVVYYKPEGLGPADSTIAQFRLEEWVKKHFYLNKREGSPYILELQIPSAVYIDGINGDDALDNFEAGSTPEKPVKTLERAFELLKTRGGNILYVVGTVHVEGNISMEENIFKGNNHIVLGSTDRIHIKRYVQPDFALADKQEAINAGYDVPDFEGTLIQVKDGAVLNLGKKVYIDGHSKINVGDEYPEEVTVTRADVESKAPIIEVDKGATLNLNNGVQLQNNNNTYTGDDNDGLGLHGGAIRNSGTTVIRHVVLDNVKAEKGSGVYQDGDLFIEGGTSDLAGHSFYLTTVNTGTIADPVWGEDHIIQTSEMIPDGQVFDVDMDHAVPGRDVVKFLDDNAFDPDADAEYDHFRLSDNVPSAYYLVQAKEDETVLELQDWNVLDVEVPSDIYLIVQRRGTFDNTTKLSAIRKEAAGDKLFSEPEYTIINKGRYEVAVSVRAFENKNTEAGITQPPITLVPTAAAALGDTDLYLAVEGLGDLMGDTTKGFTMTETSLDPYAETIVSAAPVLMGTLGAQEAGKFRFVGAVGDGFVEKYLDSTFPLEGMTREEVQKYMDGHSTTSVVNARAKYALRYKLDIIPARR